MKKTLAIVLMLMLCLTALVGCGGGGKPSSNNTTPPASSEPESVAESTAPPARSEPLSADELLEVYNTLNASDDGYKKLTYEEFRDTYMSGVEGEKVFEDSDNITYMWTSAEDSVKNFSVIIDPSSGKCKMYAMNNLL